MLRSFRAWSRPVRPALRGFLPVGPVRVLGRGISLPRPRRRRAPAQRNPFPRVSRAPARAPGRARYAAARIARPIAPARARAKRSAPPSASTSTSTIRPAGGGGAAPEPDPAGGQDFVLRAGEAACDPVQCHGLSCFVMPQMRMAHVLWSFRAWSRPVRPALRGFRPVGPASRLRQGRLVPPAPPPALLCSGTLCRAYRARLIVPARATPAPCHILSWSRCGWRICCGPFGHGAALSGRRSGVFVRLAQLRVFGRGVPFPRPRRRPACAAEPFSARIACVCPRVRLRALRGGAVRAPDCARARGRNAARRLRPRHRPPGPGRREAAPRRRPIRQAGRISRSGPARPRDRVQCHGMSCFVMLQMRMAHMLRSFRAWSRPSRPGFRGVRPVVPAWRLRQGRSIPPAPPPARLCSGTLSRAYRLRAWPRALRGGAVRAPDCACAREGETRGAAFGLGTDLHDPAGGRRRGRAGRRAGFRAPGRRGPAAGPPVQRNPFPRVSRAPARAPGRARYAAARIARPIAPARARAKRSAPPSASTSTSTIRPATGGAAPEPDPAGGQDFALRAGVAPPPARLCSGTLSRAYRVCVPARLAARVTRRRGSRA